MLPLRLVLDTNVIISAALKPLSLQRTALTIALTKPARLYLSQPVLDEYAEIFARRELGIRPGIRNQLLQLIRSRSRMVVPTRRVHATADPDDNIFLECAEAARADYLISGNLRHFPPYWRQTKIVSARDFISLAAPHLLE